jgi:hypothetical protein
MEVRAKSLLKRISDQVSTFTDKKISQVSHAPRENEWRAYISQSKPHWEDIAWRVKEPNLKGEAEVHLGFYTEIPIDELANAVEKIEKLGEGKVDQVVKNENGIRLVWNVNLNDNLTIDKIERTIFNLLPEFITIAFEVLFKSHRANEQENSANDEPNKSMRESESLYEFEIENRKIELYKKDLVNKLDWYEANDFVYNIGENWRLPTILEFSKLYEFHKNNKLEFLEDSSYWSNESIDDKPGWAWTFYFDNGKPLDDLKNYKTYIRLVRDKQ